jgi:SAM-dependent methyltransferase
MVRLTPELRPLLPGSPTVIELGNQTFKPRPGDLARARSIVAQWDDAGADVALIAEIETRRDAALEASTGDFYRALGFASYRAIDVNAKFESLVMDLNRDLVAQYGFRETFDLVTNNGTGEHVFNQAAVFANAHALCKAGGLMLHVLPFVNYLNHGFFNYNPILFHDLAAANGYELRRLSVASGRGAEVGDHPTSAGSVVLSRAELQERCAVDGSPRGSADHLFGFGRTHKRGRRPLSRALRKVMMAGPNVCVVAALRKLVDAPFQFPIQGMYSGSNIDDLELRRAYTRGGVDA